jgi:ATP-binding cassette, subfamily B, bacterial PglK
MSLISELLYLFDRRDRLPALALLFLMLLGAGFEAVGIGSVFPFIALISNPDAVQHHSVLRFLLRSSRLTSTRDFLIWCGVALMLIYILKTSYLAFLYCLQYRFIFSRQVTLSRRLLGSYLHSPYTFHLQRNSAELLRNVNSDVLWIFSQVMVPAFSIVIEALVVTVIVTMLVLVEPVAALTVIGVLGGVSALFYRLIHKRTSAMGQRQQAHHADMIKWVNQGLGSVKEAKVLGCESFFVNAYAQSSLEYARAMRFLRTASETPRLVIEGVTMGGLLLATTWMLLHGHDLQRVPATLGLFAMAAIRLMPSLNRIVSGLTSIRYYAPSIDVVYQDLREMEQSVLLPEPAGCRGTGARRGERHGDPGFTRSIELRNAHYCYPGAPQFALKGVSVTIPRGSFVAFVGASGAGKSTVIDVLLGLLTPTWGQVLVDGVDIQNCMSTWQQKIGYIPQPVYLVDDTIRRNVAFGLEDERIDDGRVWAALRAAQLEDFVDTLPDRLDTWVGEHGVRISAGQRQRIGIARALYHDPAILVLDEATSALDNETEREISHAIAQLCRHKTVITIAHRLSTVRNCDLLFFMKGGQVTAAATYDELLENNRDFQRMVRAAAASPEKQIPACGRSRHAPASIGGEVPCNPANQPTVSQLEER